MSVIWSDLADLAFTVLTCIPAARQFVLSECRVGEQCETRRPCLREGQTQLRGSIVYQGHCYQLYYERTNRVCRSWRLSWTGSPRCGQIRGTYPGPWTQAGLRWTHASRLEGIAESSFIEANIADADGRHEGRLHVRETNRAYGAGMGWIPFVGVQMETMTKREWRCCCGKGAMVPHTSRGETAGTRDGCTHVVVLVGWAMVTGVKDPVPESK
ncbi:hypothetical protein B0J13DRAFT_120068 [Dactylonectria estremocensis]|uniref:Uncharacterized protein n=1 Tax=Dactylonectria estremocensis TaxID=1079267 RepID=A0A9P9FDY9_9HYPO|nr:hypothetical protein B0J13DRAFT_120068 [Dactylonectria estremocensis]